MSNLPKLPDLGQFFGDQGGPGMISPNTPANENRKVCPFADPKMGEFCTLDGAMCPFVGFNYRRCRKYTNNMAKGNMQAMTPSAANSSGGGPPRNEALLEARRKAPDKGAKKGGSKNISDAEEKAKANQAGPAVQAFAAFIAPKAHDDPNDTDDTKEKERVTKSFFSRGLKTPDPSVFDPDSEDYILQGVQGDLIAAVLHQHHNVPRDQAYGMGYDYAQIAHAQAKEMFDRSDPKARADAYADAEDNEDSSAVDMFANKQIQGNKPRGGPTTDDAEDIETERAARGDNEPPWDTSDVPPPDDSYAPDADEHPDNTTSPEKRKIKFKAVRQTVSRQEKPGQRPKFISKAEVETKEKTKPIRGHKFGGAQQATDKMSAEQFEQFLKDYIDPLTPAEKTEVFAGMGHYGRNLTSAQIRKELLRRAKNEADKKNYLNIARNANLLWDRAKNIHTVRTNKANVERAWDANLELLKKIPVGDQVAAKMMLDKVKKDPQQQEKAAKFMNKLMDRAYDLEAKTMKIGAGELTTFVREVTVPQFKRGDYEVMRMAEQMGLAAIQKQHQYGRGYGRFNTWNLFFKQVVAPFVLFWTRNTKLIRPLMSIWPSEFLDQLYFAYIKKVLPKLSPSDSGELRASRDTKFLNSQRMMSGRHKRLMRGWHKDAVLPPDRAVLHARWYPTTKETWGKKRASELAARYEKQKALPPTTTKRTFMRR